MLRYYGKDQTPFDCEEIVERHDQLPGKETRRHEDFDFLYKSFRDGQYDLLKSLVERDEMMVSDISIWICEVLTKYDPRTVQFFFDECYKNSYKKDFLIHEAVVFYRNLHHTQTSHKTFENTNLFLLYMNSFINRMCNFYPNQVNKLHVCGGIAPIHAVLRLAVFTRSTILDALLHKADINIQDIYGATVLHHAAWDGSTENVEMLLERGADKTIKDKEKKTPFDYARECGHFEIASRLQVGSAKLEDTSARWEAYRDIECLGGPLEFSKNVTNIPEELNLTEFIESLITSKHGSGSPSLAPDAVAELKVEVSMMMKRIADIVEDYDPRFKFEPLLTGSVAQGGKVQQPDEFDYNCVLVRFSELCKDIAEEQYPGYCRLIQKDDPPKEYAEFFDNGYLKFKKVNRTLYGLIEKALSIIHLHGFNGGNPTVVIVNPPYRQVRISNVAYEMFLMCNSKKVKYLKVKVDLAVALTFKPYSFKLEPYLGEQKCMFVHMNDNNVASVNCRISMTLQENAIFRSFTEPMIKSYGLLKTIISLLSSWALPLESFIAPDSDAWEDGKGIHTVKLDLVPSTYHFKQSIIKAVLKNNREVPSNFRGREIEFWTKVTIDELINSYNVREMSTPWLPAHNILEDHDKRRAPDVPIPEHGIDRCYEYLKAHANILWSILHQKNVVEE